MLSQPTPVIKEICYELHPGNDTPTPRNIRSIMGKLQVPKVIRCIIIQDHRCRPRKISTSHHNVLLCSSDAEATAVRSIWGIGMHENRAAEVHARQDMTTGAPRHPQNMLHTTYVLNQVLNQVGTAFKCTEFVVRNDKSQLLSY